MTGKLHMHQRPQGKLLIAALLADGSQNGAVLRRQANRPNAARVLVLHRLCRDNGIAVLDATGTNLCESVMGGVNGMLAEMDRDATVARLQAGKKHWRGTKRVEGRWPYGEHPSHEYDAEHAIVARIHELHANGVSSRAIAKLLNAEGTRTRYGCEFHRSTVQNILRRARTPDRT